MTKQTLLYALLLVLLFFIGRAEGWYEANVYMERVAISLGVQAAQPQTGNW